MRLSRGLFSSATEHWSTPKDVYDALDAEFHFNFDPCPLDNKPGSDGLTEPWGSRTFVNPPWSRQRPIRPWLEKALAESLLGKLVVCLIPSRTDTAVWHDIVMQGEIRFCRGRIKFGGSKTGAPFPSAVVIFRGRNGQRGIESTGH